jgi:hypothetical protein
VRERERGYDSDTSVDIEVDPQGSRFGRIESDRVYSLVLDRRLRGENGTCPSCVGIPMAVRCASVYQRVCRKRGAKIRRARGWK